MPWLDTACSAAVTKDTKYLFNTHTMGKNQPRHLPWQRYGQWTPTATATALLESAKKSLNIPGMHPSAGGDNKTLQQHNNSSTSNNSSVSCCLLQYSFTLPLIVHQCKYWIGRGLLPRSRGALARDKLRAWCVLSAAPIPGIKMILHEKNYLVY